MEVNAQCGACEYLTENLVVNGDFSSGNSGFTTEYSLATVSGTYGLLSNGGTYGVGTNANSFHDFFAGTDHTNPGTGNYMIVNGSNVGGTLVWCQTITVVPNTEYSFSAWARNVDTNAGNTIFANLQFLVDGNALGAPFEVPGNWQNFSSTWNSGAETSIEICLVNQQTNGGGNDFGIDDITFTACLPYEIVNVPSAGMDQVICDNDAVNIGEAALANWDYTWQASQGLSNTSTAQPTLNANNSSGAPIVQTYIMEVDSMGLGCIYTDTLEVTINPLPEPDLGDNFVLCAGETDELSVTAGFESVTWSVAGEVGDQITIDEAGNYSVTVGALNCFASDNITVTTPVFPNLDLGPDTSICVDQDITFGINALGEWNTGESLTNYTADTEGWYWQELSSMGCSIRDSVYLSVINYPNIELGEDFYLCPNTTATFQLPQAGSWSTGTFSDELVISSPGNYSVVVANQQCAVADQVEALFISLPEVDLGEEVDICSGDQISFDADGDFHDNILWSTGETESFITLYNSELLTVEVSNFCATVRDSVQVNFSDCNFQVYIPNAFTPDFDGINDVWGFEGMNVAEFELILFNRWGELVWQTDSLSDTWQGGLQDGTHFGQNEVYHYKYKALSIYDDVVDGGGFVVILR